MGRMALVRHTCVGCSALSPETEETFSLLGLAGWRQQKVKTPAGKDEVRWRCGACWLAHKRATGGETQRALPTLDIVTKLDAARASTTPPKKR